jgi:hypothetical protein
VRDRGLLNPIVPRTLSRRVIPPCEGSKFAERFATARQTRDWSSGPPLLTLARREPAPDLAHGALLPLSARSISCATMFHEHGHFARYPDTDAAD